MRRPIVLCIALVAALQSPAAAHVKVYAEPGWTSAPACGTTEFLVFVPNERPDATVSVDLLIPESVRVIGTEPVPGWTPTLTMEKGRVAHIVWAGGKLHPHEYQKFAFLAGTPQTAETLSWDAIQTYEGGTVVRWTGNPGSDTPHSQTQITAPQKETDCRARRRP